VRFKPAAPAAELIIRLTGEQKGDLMPKSDLLNRVRPQMVDFGSGQGLGYFETAVIASYFEARAVASLRAQKNEHAALGRKMPFVDGH
jgi:hypothetical protein